MVCGVYILRNSKFEETILGDKPIGSGPENMSREIRPHTFTIFLRFTETDLMHVDYWPWKEA